MAKWKPKTYYLYKDKFMSGWGEASGGSFVISDKPLKRPEFKYVSQSNFWGSFRPRGAGEKHIELWEGVRTEKGRPKEICKLEYKKKKGHARKALHIVSCRKN